MAEAKECSFGGSDGLLILVTVPYRVPASLLDPEAAIGGSAEGWWERGVEPAPPHKIILWSHDGPRRATKNPGSRPGLWLSSTKTRLLHHGIQQLGKCS